MDSGEEHIALIPRTFVVLEDLPTWCTSSMGLYRPLLLGLGYSPAILGGLSAGGAGTKWECIRPMRRPHLRVHRLRGPSSVTVRCLVAAVVRLAIRLLNP
jgi:hypothetical protein